MQQLVRLVGTTDSIISYLLVLLSRVAIRLQQVYLKLYHHSALNSILIRQSIRLQSEDIESEGRNQCDQIWRFFVLLATF